MSKVTIGVDFGTLSARAVVVKTENGDVLAEASEVYSKGVMEETLNGYIPLPSGFALSDIHDYEKVLISTIRRALELSKVEASDVIGIGIDVTSSTFLPVDEQIQPLQDLPEFAEEPHAYMKLWKHHGAAEQAKRITALMNERNESFRDRAGRAVNAEWMLPKLLEICEDAPEVYKKAYGFIEAGDYLNYYLTGELTRSKAAWGYKMIRSDEDEDRRDFYRALNRDFENVEEKCPGKKIDLGECAGHLTEEAAERTGLIPGIPVACFNIDAHVSAAAAGITKTGKMLAIIGTTCCAVVSSEKECFVPGISGCVKGGILPGLYGYEAGQSAVGDMFSWFEKNCVPESYVIEARERHLSVQEYLTEKASKKKPGETGLLALDWWNGNRSHLADADLSGMILGMTLTTQPEDIYRALLEAVAYGLREIRDNYVLHGVKIDRIIACGGIPKKNPLLMQIYADVCNCDIHITKEAQASALGSSVFAAVSAGKEKGGYDSVPEAIKAMGHTQRKAYHPNPENVSVYDKLFTEFKRLHDYFGIGGNDVMRRLKKK